MGYSPVPIEMIVLQGTPFCNLNCSYCDLSVTSRKQRTQMSMDMIERVFQSVFNDRLYAPKISVVWHSGEPLTLSCEYYQAAIDRIIALRDALVPGEVELEFDFQTNAVLISDDWVKFFKAHQHHMRLGVSCDGPAELHDAFRNNWGGKPTHAKVVSGMQKLADSGIPFKIIAVVTDNTLRNPDGFFDFFLNWSDSLSGFHFNILADATLASRQGLTYSRADRDRYYRFYRHLLKRAREVVEAGMDFHIQNFTHALGRILDDTTDQVVESSRPLRTINVDAQGYVTTFYAGLEKSAFAGHYGDGAGLSLGNINEASLLQMAQSKKFGRILADFERSQAQCREDCDYYGLCSGGFELSKLNEHTDFEGGETAECVIIVKTLADAVLDDISAAAQLDEAVER
ncbi:MAG TPA: radical SAM protein [Aliiroseovarius sp.]|nr:radical SAM protein [Aliiroseovarius sp.]